jgi:ketosteroid isomerase-like protein
VKVTNPELILAEIARLEAYRARAIVAGDREGLAAMTSDDYVHVDSLGQIRDKAAFLAGLGGNGGQYVEYRLLENAIHVFAVTAVVTGSFENVHRAADGSSVTKSARHFRVYTYGGGRWLNVFHQAVERPRDTV